MGATDVGVARRMAGVRLWINNEATRANNSRPASESNQRRRVADERGGTMEPQMGGGTMGELPGSNIYIYIYEGAAIPVTARTANKHPVVMKIDSASCPHGLSCCCPASPRCIYAVLSCIVSYQPRQLSSPSLCTTVPGRI